jgi:hypothetical protein
MHIPSIITLLSWPVIIAISYFIIRWAVKIYEKKQGASR